MTEALRRRSVEAFYRDAVARLDPAERVRAALERNALSPAGVVVLAVGKAAGAMARGAASALGDRVVRGKVVVPEGGGEAPAGFERIVAAHPVPDARSERAGRAALALAESAEPSEQVLALISGGASALVCAPAAGLTLADKAAATARVMAAGAPIQSLNAVRKHLSAIKGGRLAAASAAPVTTLAASDVVGDELTSIASGPTVPDPTTFEDACRAVEQSCGMARIPDAVRVHLEAGRRGEREETPASAREGDRAEVVAGTGALVEEAVAAARREGVRAEELDRRVTGDVSDVAEMLAGAAQRAAETAQGCKEPFCFVAGGEPTVALPEEAGEGGRAQQLALLAARRIAGLDKVALLVAGSDGIDGTSGAAGAAVSGRTWRAVIEAGRDPERALAHCDAAPALAATGAQIITGPTGRNHADLMLVAAWP